MVNYKLTTKTPFDPKGPNIQSGDITLTNVDATPNEPVSVSGPIGVDGCDGREQVALAMAIRPTTPPHNIRM